MNNIEKSRIRKGRTSWSSYAWIMAESEESDIAIYVKIQRRTKPLKDLPEARAVVVATVKTTVRVLGIAVVNWDVGVDKVTL